MSKGGFWRNAAAYMLGTAALKALPLLLTPLLARYLGPEELGIYELASSYALVLQSLATLSLETAVVRFLFRDPSDAARSRLISNAFYSTLAVSSLIGAVLVVFSQAISSIAFGSPDGELTVVIVAGLVLTNGLFSFAITIFQYLGQVRRYLTFSIGFGLCISLLIFISVVFWQADVDDILLIQLAMSGFGLAIAVILLWRSKLFGARLDLAYLRELLLFSLPILAAVLMMWAQMYGSRALSVAFLSATEIGILSASMRLSSIVKLFDEGLKMIWSPFVYSSLEVEGHQEEFRDKFKKITILTFAAGAAVQLVSAEVFALLLPPAYKSGHVAFCLFVTSFCIASTLQLVSIGPTIREQTWLSTIVVALGAIISIGVTLGLIEYWGFQAIPVGLLASSTIMVVVGWAITERIYPIGYPKLLYAFWLSVLAASCAVAIFVEDHFVLRFVAVVTVLVCAATASGAYRAAGALIFSR